MAFSDSAPAREYAKAEMASRLERLRSCPYSELVNLPPHETHTSTVGRRRVTITTYRDTLTGDRVRVVVQAFVKGPLLGLGFRWVTAEGFTVSREGEIARLPNEQLYEFI